MKKLTPDQLAGLKAVIAAGSDGLAPTVSGPTSGRSMNFLRDRGLVRIDGTSDTSAPNKGVRRVFVTQLGRAASDPLPINKEPTPRDFTVTGAVTISVYTIVSANSERQAREIAIQRGMMNLGCSTHESEREEWCATELDGEPEIVGVTPR